MSRNATLTVVEGDDIFGFYLNGILYEQNEVLIKAYYTLLEMLEEYQIKYFERVEIIAEWYEGKEEYKLPNQLDDMEEWVT